VDTVNESVLETPVLPPWSVDFTVYSITPTRPPGIVPWNIWPPASIMSATCVGPLFTVYSITVG
jgi:hypothetical protein